MSFNSRAIVGIGLALGAVYLVWLSGWRNEALTSLTGSSLLHSVAALYAAVVLLRRFRHTREETFWLHYGIGMACYFSGLSYRTLDLLMTGAVPETFGLADTLWMLQDLFYLIALYLQNKNGRRPAIPFLFDILLFTTVTLTLYWQLFIQPSLGEGSMPDTMTAFSLLRSSVNLVIVLFLLLSGRSRLSLASRRMLVSGFAAMLAANSLLLYLDGRTPAADRIEALPEALSFAGILLIGFAAKVRDRPAACSDDEFPKAIDFKRYLPLTLGGILLTLLLAGSYPETPVALGSLIGVVLLIVRLFFGIRESESVNQALQESNLNYRNWVDNALVGVFIEQDGCLVYVNRHCEEIFGYGPGEMNGIALLNHLAFSDLSRFQSEIEKLKSGEPRTRFGVSGFKRDHSVLYLEMQLAATYYRGREAISGMLIDITERKMSEQYLIRSEKLSVIGQLAAGVAHEIRNPLTALKGFTQLLHRNSDDNRKYYEIMLAELERINYIVGEFMMLSKPHNRQKLEEHDIHRILSSIIPILESQAILHNVIIRIESSDALPLVKCDENQIKQVLINLMKNAIEAMPGGGTVTVRYEKDDAKRQLIVYIEDQGVGMPTDLLERLGEPFLTTKEKGTGLGLMVCFKIIQAHEGLLSVSSQPGQGTTVKLELPAR